MAYRRRLTRRRKTRARPRPLNVRYRRSGGWLKRRVKTTGLIYARRKTSAIQMFCSGTGLYAINDPTGNCLSAGAPVVVPGTTNVYDIPISMKFNLAQCINSTDFTNIADVYKMVKTQVRLHNNFVNTTVGPNGVQPWIEYFYDQDDASVPSLALLRERMGTKTKYFSASRPVLNFSLRPRFAKEVFQSGVTTAYGPGRGWLDCDYPQVQHYSIKAVIHNVPLIGSGALLDFDVTHTVMLKGIQ